MAEMNAEDYCLHGRMLFKEKHYDAAIEYFTEAMYLNPNCFLGGWYVRQHLARAYRERGAENEYFDFEWAIADYTESIRIYPESLAYCSRGDVYMKKEDYNLAITDYTAAIRLDPDTGSGYERRGSAYKAKGDMERAKADFATAKLLNRKELRGPVIGFAVIAVIAAIIISRYAGLF
jgi:tetratricopeptide (TPR) repeat protein